MRRLERWISERIPVSRNQLRELTKIVQTAVQGREHLDDLIERGTFLVEGLGFGRVVPDFRIRQG